MNILVVSSSARRQSRSEVLALRSADVLTAFGAEARVLRLQDHPLPRFDDGDLTVVPEYRFWHAAVSEADGLVLASPVYNWGCCAELKRLIEFVGSTPPDGSVLGALFDKVVTFVNAAGLPHSYMAFAPLATSLMLDFKCIINPYNVYVHSRHWEGDGLAPQAQARLEKAMRVMVELTSLLKARTYQSSWEI